MALQRIFGTAQHSSDDHWITVSDLMAGLMVIFLFIAITHVRNVEKASAGTPARDYESEIQKLAAELDAVKAVNLKQTARVTKIDELSAALDLEKSRNQDKQDLSAEIKRLAEELNAEKTLATKLQKVFEEDLAHLNVALAAERSLAEQLRLTFKDELPEWHAEFKQENLVIRFRAEGISFQPQSAVLSDQFKDILNNFFPRYLSVLNRHRAAINEVHIEGHSSSEWRGTADQNEAFFKNMELSQARARAVLEFGLSTLPSPQSKDWARRKITANGLSSSRPVVDGGRENPSLSRRVEFRVQTNSKNAGLRILQKIQNATSETGTASPE